MKKTEQRSSSPCFFAASIPAYLQDEMPEAGRREFETHLETCECCRQEVEEYRWLIQSLTRGFPERGTGGLVPGVLARVRDEERRQSRRRFVLRIAALLVCCAGGAALLFRLRPGPVETRNRIVRAAGANDGPFVAMALTWLSESQEPAGYWDAARWGAQRNYTPGISGLAVLALVRQAPAPLRGPHEETIRRGLDFLLSQQNADGCFGGLSSATPYNQGMATLALLEACALEDNPEWRAAAGRALAYIRSTQRSTGGWGPARDRGRPASTAVTAWQLQALIRASEYGWDDLDEPIERGLAWLQAEAPEFDTATGVPAAGTVNRRQAICAARVVSLSRSTDPGRRAVHMRGLLVDCAEADAPDGRKTSAGGQVYDTAMAVLAM